MSTTTPAPTPQAPAAPAAGPDGTPQSSPEGDPQDLGDAGRRALAAERSARATAEQQAREAQTALAAAEAARAQFEQQTQALTTERDAAARESLRFRVALEQGLPAALAGRLQGDDEAALIADATQLRDLIGPSAPTSTTPRPDPSQGSRTPAPTTPQAAFEAAMGPLLNP